MAVAFYMLAASLGSAQLYFAQPLIIIRVAKVDTSAYFVI